MTKAIEKVETFLPHNEEKLGRSGKPKQSNITDNESAKMPTSKGVVQGYNGLAMVDAKTQVIVHAEGTETGLLQPMIEGTIANFSELEIADDVFATARLTADAGYSSEANSTYLFENGIDAYVADTLYRKRNPRFEDAERHKPTRPDESFAKPKEEKTQFPKRTSGSPRTIAAASLFCLVHNIGKVQHHGSRVMTRTKRGRRRAS